MKKLLFMGLALILYTSCALIEIDKTLTFTPYENIASGNIECVSDELIYNHESTSMKLSEVVHITLLEGMDCYVGYYDKEEKYYREDFQINSHREQTIELTFQKDWAVITVEIK